MSDHLHPPHFRLFQTRMQVFATSPAPVYTGVGNAFTRISSTEGMRALWRGVSSVIMGAGPAHAMHFGAYEAVKELAGGNIESNRNQWLATSLAGASTTIASDALMNPFDGEISVLNPAGAYSPVTHMISGGLSGAVEGAVTTPLDVAKTILQTRGTSQDAEIRHRRGLMDAFRTLWQRDGFARGLTPRALTFMPSNALCWLSYEFFKAAIRE